jgi:hypothetical protein
MNKIIVNFDNVRPGDVFEICEDGNWTAISTIKKSDPDSFAELLTALQKGFVDFGRMVPCRAVRFLN